MDDHGLQIPHLSKVSIIAPAVQEQSLSAAMAVDFSICPFHQNHGTICHKSHDIFKLHMTVMTHMVCLMESWEMVLCCVMTSGFRICYWLHPVPEQKPLANHRHRWPHTQIIPMMMSRVRKCLEGLSTITSTNRTCG